jgi:hypothetical protein
MLAFILKICFTNDQGVGSHSGRYISALVEFSVGGHQVVCLACNEAAGAAQSRFHLRLAQRHLKT